MRPNLETILVSLAACATLTACAADSTSPGSANRTPVTLSFATASSTGASADRAGTSGASFSLTATSGADVLVVTRAQLVLSRLELQRVGATCTSADSLDDHGGDRAGSDDRGRSGDDDGCAELELSPNLVDLPVTGSVATTLSVTVPAGQYSAFEAKIAPVDTRSSGDDKGSTAFLAAHPDLAGVSVRVEGTFNGKAFTYTGAPRAQLESRFDPPLAVADGAANVTVHVDLANWFKTSAGVLIDPATANANGANAALVAANIRQSFRAFRDDDRNGHDDHDNHGGDDHGNSGRR